MQKTRIMVLILGALLVLSGCSGAKFAKEKTVLDTLTKGMESFTSAIGSADNPAAITKALGSFSGILEKVMPQMKALASDHPDWKNNPPAELKDTLDKFNQAQTGFQNAVPKVMSFAKEHMDNADLQSAVSKFSDLLKKM